MVRAAHRDKASSKPSVGYQCIHEITTNVEQPGVIVCVCVIVCVIVCVRALFQSSTTAAQQQQAERREQNTTFTPPTIFFTLTLTRRPTSMCCIAAATQVTTHADPRPCPSQTPRLSLSLWLLLPWSLMTAMQSSQRCCAAVGVSRPCDGATARDAASLFASIRAPCGGISCGHLSLRPLPCDA